MRTPGEFVLHGGDVAFANRQKLLFDRLSVAEKECIRSYADKAQDMDVDAECQAQTFIRRDRIRRSEMSKFRGRESIFKRPEGPAPRVNFRSIPDHHRNPHKWTKYSLDDVSTEDMTDQSNTQAAMSFLSELKKRKMKQRSSKVPEKMDIDVMEVDESQDVEMFKSKKLRSYKKIQFRKPQCDAEEARTSYVVTDVDDKPIFRSSKVIMPEYVVGQKQKKKDKIKQPTVRVDRTKQMRLRHLEEPDEI